MALPKEEGVCNHVKVVVRVRPETQKEKQNNFTKVVHVIDQHMLVFDPKEGEVGFFNEKRPTYRDINKRQQKDLKFMFDAVFDESASQLEVFEQTTKTLIDGFLNGYNCTVLAYGATGAGKTHTMLGSPEDPGVMYLTMMALYNRMDQIKEDKICEVGVSYLEIYNEQIRDLLVSSGPLAVREDDQRGVVVRGLTLHQPKSAEEILQMLDYGNKNRTQHPTDVNASSSRSHAVFQIYLQQKDKAASINQNVRVAKMCLIDLAGSERASATNAKGARFVEGKNINRSLLALGNVINALADPKHQKHIPYRNSKLTRLLKDSLGGNCRTIMIAAVSPSSLFYDDTYNTLRYANRAKDIKSSLKSNVISLGNHISQYVKVCNEQKKEILMLKEKLRQYEENQVSLPKNCNAAELSSNQQVEIERYKDILKNVFANREEIRKEYLNVEKKLKENTLKKYYHHQCHEQTQLMCSEETAEKATCKRDQRLSVLDIHCVHMQKKKEEVLQRFEENTKWLHRVENEMRLLGQDGCIPKELHQDLQYYHSNLEVQNLKAQVKHMLDLLSLQHQYHKETQKVLNTLLPVHRKQYLALKEAGLTNYLTETEFGEVEQLIQRKKSVSWADQTKEDPSQSNEVEMSAIFAFPQLVSRPSTPCTGSEEGVKLVIDVGKEPTESKEKNSQSKKVEISLQSLNPLLSPGSSVYHLLTGHHLPAGHEGSILWYVCYQSGGTSLGTPSQENTKNTQKVFECTELPQKKTRRKLMDSPVTAQSPAPCKPCSLQHLEDSLAKEVQPIVYTPESCPKPGQSCCAQAVVRKALHLAGLEELSAHGTDRPMQRTSILDTTHDVLPECDEGIMNSTITLYEAPDENTDMSSYSSLKESQPCTDSIVQRIKTSASALEKPSYMAMTSSAQRKRKVLSSTSNTGLGGLQDAVSAKRIRQDVLLSQTPLRVPQVSGIKMKSGKEEQDVPRIFGRSFSQGNVTRDLKSRTSKNRLLHVSKKKTRI